MRLRLCVQVFTRHRSTRDGLLSEEAAMAALGEVMGGVVSPRLTSTIWQTVGVEIAPHIENKFNYREFAGLAAFTERIYCWEYTRSDTAGPNLPKVDMGS